MGKGGQTQAIGIARGLNLPPRAITESIAVMGRKGSGKTYTGTLLFELFHAAGAQCVALDPVGAWWGLRLSKTGKSTGLDIPVFGGVHGDIPITPGSGRMLARVIAERRISCVIDLLLFSKGKRKQFVVDFAEELFEQKKRDRAPLHLFLEEARKFVPQKPMKGDERMLGAFEDIVRLGRNFGLGATLIDQRPQSVNKEVLSQTEILIAHQLTHHLDHKQIREWVSANARVGLEALAELEELEAGQAFFWSPGLMKTFKQIKVRAKKTFDASATPELGAGGAAAGPRPLSATDLDKLRASMEEVVAEAEASDPKALQKALQKRDRQLVELNKQIASLEKRLEERVEVEVPMVTDETIETMQRLVGTIKRELDVMSQDVESIADTVNTVASWVRGQTRSRELNGKPRRAPRPATPAPASKRADDSLTGPERRILDALAWLEYIGVERPVVTAVAFLAGYSPRGGAFNNPKGKLRSKGLIEYHAGKRLSTTTEGSSLADPPLVPLTNSDLQDAVLRRLGGPERRILAPLLEAYPEPMDTDALAEAAGYSARGGAFNNPRGRLRTLGLVEYPESGSVRASDLLFPEGS